MLNWTNNGFITLVSAKNGEQVLIKVKHITEMASHENGSYVWVPNEVFWVKETIEQITEKLENVHPDFL